MLIVSWNVAGLSTTVNRIHDSYVAKEPTFSASAFERQGKGLDEGRVQTERSFPGTNVVSARTKSNSSIINTCDALAIFMERHGADILCVQEHKIPKLQLINRIEPRHLSNVAGYETFWSCCVDETARGLNGACTYARKGSVISAHPAPLNDPELDCQGRCVMTDHGEFILFNVYVPANGGQPLSHKLKFLQALRSAMQRQRQTKNKPIILVGDLNITNSCSDVHWLDRVVYVDHVLHDMRQFEQSAALESTVASSSSSLSSTIGLPVEYHNALPDWKVDVAKHWTTITSALKTLHVVPTTTRNIRTNQEFQKYRAAVFVDGKRVLLGKHETVESWCLHDYLFLDADTCILSDSSLVDGNASEQQDEGDVVVVRDRNVVSIGVLAELLNKITGVMWCEEVQRQIADSYATVIQESPTRKWLRDVLEEDDMIDAFRYLYPTASGRYTCWNQSTNRRYSNEGMRIDYTLVDRCLIDHIQKGSVAGLRCGRQECDNDECCNNALDNCSDRAALAAATANGRFQPASFEGGGIQEASQDALDSQFGTPHTGIIYTPPSFSDHVAISLLLDDALLRDNLNLDTNDAWTKKAQPHKLQKSITAFFGSASSTGVGATRMNTCVNERTARQSPCSLSSFTSQKKFKVEVTVKMTTSHLSVDASKGKRRKISTQPTNVNSILNHFQRKNSSA